MKLDATLGGIAALMLAGVFYTFAFCMVENVDEDIISPEFYYIEPAEDDLLAEAVQEKIPDTNENEFPETKTEENEDSFEEESVPAAVTTVPEKYAPAANETVTAPQNKVSNEPEYKFPEDYDVGEYSDSSTEAQEQSVYGGDNFEDETLYTDTDDIDDEIFASESDEESETDDEQEPLQAETNFPSQAENASAAEGNAAADIVITLFDSDDEDSGQSEEPSVSVNAADSSGTSTSETFTARFDGAVQTVNAYDLICWIVNNEISPSFSDEAIKAQAVAAYSYVKYHNVNGLTPNVLVKKNPPDRIKELVSSVWGVCCYYNGSVAQTVYMASSSGYTADAANVWGGDNYPYLKSVRCPFDSESDPNYGVTMTVSESNMRSYLENSLGITLSGNPRNWITVTGYVDGNYVSSIDIDGQTIISGRKMRETVLGYKLKSAAFDVYYSNGEFTFTTYGYGHGVGMSQNGANILAKQGCSYSEILKFYFTGIEVL